MCNAFVLSVMLDVHSEAVEAALFMVWRISVLFTAVVTLC